MNLETFTRRFAPEMLQGVKQRTEEEYLRLLRTLILPEFGSHPIESVSAEGVARWHRALAETTPYQANRALAVVSRVFRLAQTKGAATHNPANGVIKAPEGARERPLTTDELQRLYDTVYTMPPIEGSFLLVMLYTGARPSELANAEWEHFTGDTIQLPDSKTGRRTIYLSGAARSALAPVADRRSGPIFPGVQPQNLWKRFRRRAQLPAGVRLYDLRHTFATYALSAGTTLEIISQMLGHKDPRTTRRYTHLLKDTALEAGDKTANALGHYNGS